LQTEPALQNVIPDYSQKNKGLLVAESLKTLLWATEARRGHAEWRTTGQSLIEAQQAAGKVGESQSVMIPAHKA